MTFPAEASYERLKLVCRELDAPFALVDLDAIEINTADLVRRAQDKPIRVASKSVRCRELLRKAVGQDGFNGVLAFTLPEALWLASDGFENIVVGYPTTDRHALRELAGSGDLTSQITLMVDSTEQLDFIARNIDSPQASPLRLAIEFDVSNFYLGGRFKLGAERSPLHDPASVVALAEEIGQRETFTLVGLMAYEGQISSFGDRPAQLHMKLASKVIRPRATKAIAAQREEVVAAVRKVAELEFVNGGGTGSFESTGTESAVTELAAGSGLYGPTLFDQFSAFRPAYGALFALPVIRRPGLGVVTVLGGGYIASGPPGADKLPTPVFPAGLKLRGLEGAGEVNTPLLGDAADQLKIGDNVYFRHAKAGEMCERFDRLHLIQGNTIVDEVPTYRGEGKTFL